MVFQTKQLTVAEFDQFILLPENVDREFEYIGRRIYQTLSSPLSSGVAVRIAGFFGIYLLRNDIGHLTGADGGYIVSGERYIPDVGFISYMKQPELISVNGYNPNPPDLAVEVLSPSNDDEKMRIKIQNYQAAGTVVWAADPIAQSIEVYRLGQPVMIVSIDGVLDGGDVLPNFKLAVKDIFPVTPEKD